jgi:mannosyltransferase OCH1-like enzyme
MKIEIPKIIHYCWFGGGEFSPLHIACMQTWKRYLGDYRIVCWDEKNSPMEHPFIQYHYKNKNWAFVSDYVRLYAIYHYGGIYMDVDFEVLKNFDLLRQNSCFLGYEQDARITNGICGGVKNSIFFKEAMELMNNRHNNKKAILLSPEVCTEVYIKLKSKNKHNDIRVYSQNYFYPYNPFDSDAKRHFLLANYITKDTFAIHHWAHSWKIGILKRILRKAHKLILG